MSVNVKKTLCINPNEQETDVLTRQEALWRHFDTTSYCVPPRVHLLKTTRIYQTFSKMVHSTLDEYNKNISTFSKERILKIVEI